MDLDRAEIKCSNKNLKINWFVKRCNVGPVWELLTPGYGLLRHLTHHTLLKNLSVDIEI